MAGRPNLLESATSQTWRDWATMARATMTSRMSKSRSVPSGSMPLMPIRPMSTLNCSMKDKAASPTTPRSSWRTVPPATTTSQCGLALSVRATCRLLVTTRRPWWCSSSRATASTVVPMFMNRLLPRGMAAATVRAIRCLASAWLRWRSAWAVLRVLLSSARTPPWKRSSTPASVRRWTSRRTVCRVVWKRSAKASILSAPCSRTVCSIASWRGFRAMVMARVPALSCADGFDDFRAYAKRMIRGVDSRTNTKEP